MRRGRLSLLETCQERTHKTALVYKTNLNFRIVNGYLDYLQGKGWIAESEGKYWITDEGKRFLEMAKEVLNQL